MRIKQKIKWFIDHYFKHKKCPYCGSRNWSSYMIIDDIPNYKEIRYQWIECKDCGTKTPEYRSKDFAMRAWDHGNVITSEVNV